jgi:hypothetical protein
MPEILENAEEDLTPRMRNLLALLWSEWKDHHGQETHLHKQAGYIDADFLHPPTFPLQSDGGPYI